MSYEGLRKQVEDLAAQMPSGYHTWDEDAHLALDSRLPGFVWFGWAMKLCRSRGRKEEKKRLRVQLARSVGPDGDGGLLYQVVAACAQGPVEKKS